jgi:hypothetical protein
LDQARRFGKLSKSLPPPDKSPGSDGYTGRFYEVAWLIIKADFLVALKVILHDNVSKLHLLNSSYVILLPKKIEALEIKDFRPIGLIHSFAKIVTKILANRLAARLPELVSSNKSAFVKGRTGEVLMTISHWCSKQPKPSTSKAVWNPPQT